MKAKVNFNFNSVEIRPDKADQLPRLNLPISSVDEIVIGDWFHLERMTGTNKRGWCLIITNEKKECLNLYITEKDGAVIKTTLVEKGWE